MGTRFRKSKKVGPFRFTVSKSGISTSVGGKGYRVTKRADGKIQTTTSIPGTGISHTEVYNSANKTGKTTPQPEKKEFLDTTSGKLITLVIILGVVFMIFVVLYLIMLSS